MTPNEQYLRNLVIVARADGSLQYAEQRMLEQVVGELGASPEELKAALSAFGNPSLCFDALERFSTKLRNLEDLVAIAVADGELSDNERHLLIRAALELGLSQTQTNQILSDVLQRLGARVD